MPTLKESILYDLKLGSFHTFNNECSYLCNETFDSLYDCLYELLKKNEIELHDYQNKSFLFSMLRTNRTFNTIRTWLIENEHSTALEIIDIRLRNEGKCRLELDRIFDILYEEISNHFKYLLKQHLNK